MDFTQIPDSYSIPQFLFSQQKKNEPSNPVPWIVNSVTGDTFTRETLQRRTQFLAQAMVSKFNIGPDAVGKSHNHIFLSSISFSSIVGIISANCVDYVTSFWAAHLVGAAVFVTNPGFSAQELVPQLLDARPTLIIVQSDSFLAVREASILTGLSHKRIVLMDSPSDQVQVALPLELPFTVQDLVESGAQRTGAFAFTEFELKPGEGKSKVAILFPSSGTMGSPKLILISHYAFIANILQAAAYDRGSGLNCYNPGDISCAALPFFHILGFLINVEHLLLSMTVVIVPKFNIQFYIETIERFGVTHLLIVPPMISLFLKILLEENWHNDSSPKSGCRVSSLASLRVICIAGAPLSEQVVKLANLIPQATIGQIYGMTESGALTAPTPGASIPTSHTNSGVVIYSVGKLLPGVISRVVKNNGSSALRGETGELWVRSPSVALGYSERREKEGVIRVLRWLQTGDEVYFDENDELFVVQRIKGYMKVKGFRVNPAEIEGRLLQHPDVVDCCVVAIPHEYCGQVPKAYVVLSSDARNRFLSAKSEESHIRETLLQHASANMISYKHLTGGIEFCDSIPKTPSGKHIRRLLSMDST
ncbi:acetyl-CoA synthetase-like protein [Mycena pura]|uniref:Acetyl-CoA synthetase-like protein n=1 Tax=Mycena pura TaxID=153505 RepID=A0AAD6YIB7_9AGAR|nr:acetyl-CoA synthetase-like protein [Mycena pura]